MSKRFALEEYKPKKDAYEKVCAVTGSDLPLSSRPEFSTSLF